MAVRPSSRHSFGSCVVLPDPVSPATTTTWWSRIALSRSSRRALIGSSGGYSITGPLRVGPVEGSDAPSGRTMLPRAGEGQVFVGGTGLPPSDPRADHVLSMYRLTDP